MDELDILSYNEEDDSLNDVLTKKKYESASEVLQNYERLKKISKSSLVLNKYDIDPALATGPFITTTNDIIGLLIYFLIGWALYF